MSSGAFVKYFLSILGGLLAAILSLTLLVDPYGVERLYNKKGFNLYKDAFHRNTRVTKLPLSEDVDPRTLFLGTSRTEYLAPEQELPPAEKERSFNFALSGGTVHEMKELLEWAVDRYPIERVYYGIDFVTLTSRNKTYRKGFDKELVDGKQPLWAGEARFFLTWTAIERSMQCIRKNREDPEGRSVKYQYNEHGSRTNRWRRMALEEKGKAWLADQFQRIYDQYDEIYTREGLSLPKSRLEVYKRIRSICSRNGIEFKAFVPPVHEAQFHSLMRSSGYPLYEDFLTFLAGNGGFYYFQDEERITRDSSNFWDTQHPRGHLSGWMMPRILGEKKEEDAYVDETDLPKLLEWVREKRDSLGAH